MQVKPVQTQCFIYADDIVVIADSVDSLQVAVAEWSEELKRRLAINLGKSKIMQVGEEEAELRIVCEGHRLEQVAIYENLETVFCRDGKMDQEVIHRVLKANQVFFQISRTLA